MTSDEMSPSARMYRWHADVAAQHAKNRAPITNADLAAAVADVVTDATETDGPRYRLVTLRPTAPVPADCETCGDLGRVFRIRGGLTWGEPCPDCEEVDPEWNQYTELWDDARRGK